MIKSVILAGLAALFCGTGGLATTLTTTASGTQSISLSLNSAAKVSVPASLSLTKVGTAFQDFTGSQLLNYRARTRPSGSATLTVKGSTDFSPANGPSIANGDLTFTCGAASLGTSCSGTKTGSTSSAVTVVSVPASACVGTGCASTDPATITLTYDLIDNPQFRTGTYSGQLLFTFTEI